MQKSELKYIAEWCNAVPARWYGMLVILLALVAATVAGIIWVTDKGLDWWWIALGAVLVLIFIIFSFLAYRKVAIQRDEAFKKLNASDKSISESELKLREMRLKVRNTKVSEIPDILINLRNEVETIGLKKQGDKVNPQVLLSIYLETLGITKDDPILKIKLFDNKKMFQELRKRTGIKTYNPKRIQDYRRRFSENINSHKIGIENLLTDYYKNEKRKLYNIVTSDKLLNDAIDNYIQELISFNNLRLFWHYLENLDDVQVKSFFDSPANRNLYKKLEERINKDIKDSLADVLRLLEKYQTGEPLSEGEE